MDYVEEDSSFYAGTEVQSGGKGICAREFETVLDPDAENGGEACSGVLERDGQEFERCTSSNESILATASTIALMEQVWCDLQCDT